MENSGSLRSSTVCTKNLDTNNLFVPVSFNPTNSKPTKCSNKKRLEKYNLPFAICHSVWHATSSSSKTHLNSANKKQHNLDIDGQCSGGWKNTKTAKLSEQYRAED
jgi:hypothetical protein